jgi:hypothetical protein
MNLWSVSLRPVNCPPGPEFEAYPASRLVSWGGEIPYQHYSKSFQGLRPGEYELSVSPIELRTRVQVVEGEVVPVALEVPALAELRIWPVSETGQEHPAALRVGQLGWMVVNDASRERESTDPTYKYNTGPSKLLVDIQRGYAHFAKVSENGSWVITAVAGQEIELYYLGAVPTSGRPIRFVLEEGESDGVLEIPDASK